MPLISVAPLILDEFMHYQEAKEKILRYRLVGLLLLIGGGVFTLISMLKFLYFGLDSGDPLSHGLAQPFKNLALLAYGWTSPYLDIVWRTAAVPNPRDLVSWGNVGFIFEYLAVIFGIDRIRAAGSLTGRVAQAKRTLEDEQLRESVRSGGAKPPVQIQPTTPVPSGNDRGFKLFHTLYLAPIVVGVIVLFIGKQLHLT
jgi:hypothetical protein